MNPEQLHHLENSEEKEQPEKRKTVVGKRVEKLISLVFRVELRGAEKFKEIPKNKHLIFLITHMSDYDVPLAIAALSKEEEKLKIAEASTHEEFSKNPYGYLGREIIGEENSFTIEFTGGKGDGEGIFNPDNFEPMKGALEDGYNMVAAAYYDTDYQGKQWRLPEKGGYGGVYLANITEDSIIIPVAVDIKSKKPFGMAEAGVVQIIKERRPKVEVNVGDPIEPSGIKDLDKFAEILRKRKQNIPVTSEEREIFRNVHTALRQESDRVMRSLANLLPEEKKPISKRKELL